MQIQHLPLIRALSKQARLEIGRTVCARAVVDTNHCRARQVLGIGICDRAGEARLDGGHAGEVPEVAGAICGDRSGRDRGEEAEILRIDGERVGVHRLVDLLPRY